VRRVVVVVFAASRQQRSSMHLGHRKKRLVRKASYRETVC
jgi:hypothetical protein